MMRSVFLKPSSVLEVQKLNVSLEGPDKGIPLDHLNEPVHRAISNRPESDRKIFLRTLGENVRNRRRKKPIKVIADQAGISVKTLERIEEGVTEPSFNTLYRLASILGPIRIDGDKKKRHIAST